MKSVLEAPPETTHSQHQRKDDPEAAKAGLKHGLPKLRPPVPEAGLGTQIGLSPVICHRVIETLQRLQADEIVLSLKTRNFHWNVEGPEFYQLHQLFDQQYGLLDGLVDEIAERIRAVGGYAPGSMHECLSLTRIPEVGGSYQPDSDGRMEHLLLRDHEQVICELRTLIDAMAEWGDAGTQDFVTMLLARHEKMAWMLRASCAGPRA
jgi:starvation-inducible DNA-binding protein